MSLNRRSFLRHAGAGLTLALSGARIALPERLSAHGAPGNALRIPSALTGNRLTAVDQTMEIWPGSTTAVWTYNQQYPAPTIRVRRGTTFNIGFTNALVQDSIIHWHGLILPAAMDGHPRFAVASGKSFDYSFMVDQPAGTYWYHPHPDMHTAEQVYRGMAGFFIIEDDAETALGLPSGAFDIPVMVQDHRLDAQHSFHYELAGSDHLNGVLGDTVLANGTPDAYLDVSRALYRFRILNASNARVYDIRLGNDLPFYVIGNDGGLLDRPYQVTSSMLAPAERLEILVDFTTFASDTSVMLHSAQYAGGTGRQQGAAMDILRFDVKSDDAPVTVPSTLRTIEKLNPDDADSEREFLLQTDDASTPPMHMINGKTFDMVRIDDQVTAGTMETWTFLNTTPLPHPMHVHGTLFQVVERNGNPPTEPRDFGWKDTIYLPPYSNAKVVMRFASYTGVYLVHCHNLEHEDHGMMLNFEVLPKQSAVNASDEAGGLKLELR